MGKRFSSLLIGLAAFSAAFAQNAEPQPEAADTLSLPGYEELDELVIEAQKPVMQTDGAKLTYNVDEDPGANSSTALEILKKVPQISVDGDGNIRLNGSSDFKFQLNGLENPMLKQYGDKIFAAMPANAIVRIEVITEPGAKEDAEGNAGIINIITERTKQSDGYNGTVTLQADNRALTPSLYGVLKKDKVTVSANLNYQWAFEPQKGEQDMTATYLGSTENGSLNTNIRQQTKYHFVGGGLDLSWEPNARNLFTAGANIFYVDGDITSIFGTTRRFDDASNLPWSFSQDGTGGMKVMNVSANASYRHNFALEGSNYLVLSYLFNFGNTDINIDRSYRDLINYPQPEYMYQSQATRTFDRGHTVQLDYANDFHSEHHLMEVGAKGIFRHNTALSSYGYGATLDGIAIFPDESSNIMQPQNIYSGYASYTGSFDKFGVVAGLRYEHTRMGLTDRLDSKKNFRNRLNDWVPNAALTWNFSPASNLRLAYQMRISRPSIEQVNPFQLTFSPYEVREGNPDLKSERSHQVSLKYSAFGRVVGGTVGLEYNLADNAISSFTYLRKQDGVTTVVTSYANIGKRQDVALTGFFNWNIISHMNLTLNGRLAYNKLSAPSEGYRNHGWSGNIGGAWNFTPADVYKFSVYGGWYSRSLIVQGYTSGYYYYGISAGRDFLADKSLTLSISANNFMQKKMTFKGYTATPEVIYESTGSTLSAWRVGVSISWKFGNLNAKVKNTGVEVKNDDINSSSNKGRSGI